jgi:hypothetical protein
VLIKNNTFFKLSDITNPNHIKSGEISMEWEKIGIEHEFSNSYIGINFGGVISQTGKY